ncbi:flagella synthesis protein FlgN [Marinimicrobium sp. ABcell2]|uniref:flagella synthesis protein FlgN n=1 Tax=Marinimicrobium sp. ABcell2 TaxID=3069751 RepID=UPI0027B05141|nr:flagellar protein FlgN [Marinimicrobium sp. ABcell2]MDQ2075459.1 flagellar protein FlgN [Marinimicrobium sp. ABcell2]
MQPSTEILRAMLAQDTANVEQLSQLLTAEREHLEAREHEHLPALIEAKEQLLAHLGQHSQVRQQWLEQANLSRDQHGWIEFLHGRADTRALIEPWQALIERFAQCQELNEVNGKIIGRSRQTLGQLLNLLRGQVSGPQLYNSEGGTAPESGSHTIVKA